MTPTCPYCGQPSKLVGGEVIYPHRPDLYDKQFYRCEPCDAYVGCHGKTKKPLGRLANAGLRKLKMAAHRSFDRLWKDGEMGRSDAYAWLAEQLDIPGDECHIGMFDEARCKQVIVACNRRVLDR